MAEQHNRVTVRYRVTVYADVNLDTREVLRVVEYDESARLDPYRGVAPEDIPLNVVEPSYLDDPDGIEGPKITALVAKRAVEIAETADWPSWERA